MNDRFLRACRREPVDCTPVWLMRQAGRYMPEYRRLRERHRIEEIIATPDLAVEVTLQPVNAFDVDAAIIFSDILPPLAAMGLELEFVGGEGPVIRNPVRSPDDVAALRVPDPRDALGFTLDAIRMARVALENRLPLIGFAGAPFTLACYAVEGCGSATFATARRFMHGEPAAWQALMDKLTRVVGAFLVAQVDAGAQAVQVFDSWAGLLSPADYCRFALPYSRRVIEQARQTGAPVIHFATGAGGYLEEVTRAGGDLIGLDWRVPLDWAWTRVGFDKGVQGNLDPAVLSGSLDEIAAQTQRILNEAAGRPGHIFNLGHGVLPQTPVEHVAALVDLVHDRSRR